MKPTDATKESHSPLPWQIHVFHTSTGERQTLNCVGKSMTGRDWTAYVKTADGTSVLETDGATPEEALANAEVAITAVNERERLREALRACQFELLTMIPRVTPQYRKNLQAAVDLAKTVLDATPSTSAG